MNSSSKKQAILVTGSHRSGTTWIGKVISQSLNSAYIHEPFNPINKSPYFNPGLFDKWFTEANTVNYEIIKEAFTDVMSYKTHGMKFFFSDPSYQNAKYAIKAYYQAKKWKRRGSRILFKDPIALMSIESLCKMLDMSVIGVFRHPAAFVSSSLLKKWDFDFSNFLSQPSLIEGKLANFKIAIENANNSNDQILRAATLWVCLNSVLFDESRKNPTSILTVKHEDISLEPMKYFQRIFDFLNEPFDNIVIDEIERTTSGQYIKGSTKVNNVIRDSKKNIFVWKDRS